MLSGAVWTLTAAESTTSVEVENETIVPTSTLKKSA